MKKSSVLTLAATAILCGVPLARQQVTIHGLETRLTSIATADVAESRKAGSRGMTKLPSLIERLARDLNSKEFDMPIYLTATEHLAELDDAALAGLIRETISSSMSVSNREILLGHLLGILSERNVQASLDTLLEVVPIEYLGTSQRAKNMLANGIRILSEQDSQRALAWFNAHLEIIRTIPEPSVSSNDRLENHMRIALSQNLIFTNADQAIEVLRPVPSVQLVAQFPDLSQNNDPRMKKDASSYFQVVREVLPKENSIKIISDFVGMNALRNNFGTVDVLLETYEFTPEETDAIYISSGSWRLEPALLRDGGLEKTIHEYRTWLESKSSDAAERYIGQALGRTVQCWPSTIDPIYQAMLDSEKLGLGEQAVINLLATAGQQVGMERSTKLAEQISNPESARRLLAQIKKGGEP